MEERTMNDYTMMGRRALVSGVLAAREALRSAGVDLASAQAVAPQILSDPQLIAELQAAETTLARVQTARGAPSTNALGRSTSAAPAASVNASTTSATDAARASGDFNALAHAHYARRAAERGAWSPATIGSRSGDDFSALAHVHYARRAAERASNADGGAA
jgi:hypothetical protein